MNLDEINEVLEAIIFILIYIFLGFLISYASQWEHILILGIVFMLISGLPDWLGYIFLVAIVIDLLDKEIADILFVIVIFLFLITLLLKLIIFIRQSQFQKEKSHSMDE